MERIIQQLRELIDVVKSERDGAGRSEYARVLSIAVTEGQDFENWLVRANHELHKMSEAPAADAPRD